MHRVRLVSGFLFLAVLAAGAARADGPFVGADLGWSEPQNPNFRAHDVTGVMVSPYAGYMFNDYLGAQGQILFDVHGRDAAPTFPYKGQSQATTSLGAAVGPRLALPFWEVWELYATVQGGVFTGLSGSLSHTAPGFSVGPGIEYKLTSAVSATLSGRWNRMYQSPRPTDLSVGQLPRQRFGEDARWFTVGLGLKYTFPPKPPSPPVVAEVPPIPEEKVQRRIILRAVYFDFDKAIIRPDAAPVLDEAVDMMKSEGIAVIAQGHTDSIGTDEYNLKLSRRRADAVRNYLVAHGVAPSRITTEGFGESRPVDTNDTPEGRAKNRRVELHVQ
jgi:outer membrane protein OmpA-like peptidoglycan-associated protein